MELTPNFLTPVELAARWNVKLATLEQQRYRRIGCPFIKVGGCVRYPLDEVEKIERAISHRLEE